MHLSSLPQASSKQPFFLGNSIKWILGNPGHGKHGHMRSDDGEEWRAWAKPQVMRGEASSEATAKASQNLRQWKQGCLQARWVSLIVGPLVGVFAGEAVTRLMKLWSGELVPRFEKLEPRSIGAGTVGFFLYPLSLLHVHYGSDDFLWSQRC